MSVIIYKFINFGDTDQEVKTYQPAGVVTRTARLRADRLDKVLEKRIPVIASELLSDPLCINNNVRRWFLLGKKLREIVDDRDLVLQEDIDNMLIWQAIWYYLPKSIIPQRTKTEKHYADKQHKRQDHLSLCYELSRYNWEDVNWIKRWSDVHEITARPALLRDKRIFIALGRAIDSLDKYLTLSQFREIMKLITKEFPTRKYRNSHMINDEEIDQKVFKAVVSITEKDNSQGEI